MKLCKTKILFISEHSYTKAFEYHIGNLAK